MEAKSLYEKLPKTYQVMADTCIPKWSKVLQKVLSVENIIKYNKDGEMTVFNNNRIGLNTNRYCIVGEFHGWSDSYYDIERCGECCTISRKLYNMAYNAVGGENKEFIILLKQSLKHFKNHKKVKFI